MGDQQTLGACESRLPHNGVEVDGLAEEEVARAVATAQECALQDPDELKSRIMNMAGGKKEDSNGNLEESPIEESETFPEISEDEYPSWYKEGQYDAAVVFCNSYEDHSDKGDAYAFKNLLERLVGNGDRPQLCMIDSLMFTNSKLQQLHQLIEKSTLVFLFVTDMFIGDAYCQMQKDELIMTTIEDFDNRWKVIPVMPRKPTKRLPLGIKALNNLSLTRLNYRGNLKESLDSLTHENIRDHDRYFLASMDKLFQGKKHLKKARKERDGRDLKRWIEAEKKRRKEKMCKEKEEFEEKEALRKTGPRHQPTQITINTSTLQIGDNNQLTNRLDGKDSDDEETEFQDDSVVTGANDRMNGNCPEEDLMEVKKRANDLNREQDLDDKALIAREEMNNANIPARHDPHEPLSPGVGRPPLLQLAGSVGCVASVGSINSHVHATEEHAHRMGANQQAQRYSDLPVAPPAGPFPRYDNANPTSMPVQPICWGRPSFRVIGGQMTSSPWLRSLQNNITTFREVQKVAAAANGTLRS